MMVRPLGRELARTSLSWLSVFALVAIVVGGMSVPTHAAVSTDTDNRSSVAATISDVEVSQGQLEALLTVTSPHDTVTIDPESVRVRLAGGDPVRPQLTVVRHEPRSVMLAIDTSGSMGDSGIAAAVAAARTFLRQVPSDVKVGLAAFAEQTKIVEPTRNREAVSTVLRSLNPGGETALYDGLIRALAAFPPGDSKTLMLLSDGGDTVSDGTLQQVMHRIASEDVRVDAVSFRTKESDNKALGKLGKAGQGRVLEAADKSALTRVFANAASALAGQVRLSVPVPDGIDGSQHLQVGGTAKGNHFRARTAVTFPEIRPGPPSSPATAAPSPDPATPAQAPVDTDVPTGGLLATRGWAVGAGALVFLGLLGLGLAVASPVFLGTAKRRVRAMDQLIGAPARAKEATTQGSSVLTQGALKMADSFARQRSGSARTALLLERADLPLRLNEWYVLRAAAVVVSFAVFWLWWRGSLLGVLAALVVGAGVGLVLPVVYLRVKASLRANRLEAQLPDVLTLIASSLSTGFSLPQALDAITKDAAEPSAKEFSRALAETRIGSDIEDSLDRLAMRMGSTNLQWTVMAIRIQRQVGGNLAETLRTTAATLRDREALKRQVRALSAEGKLSAYILVALPFGLFGYMMVVNRPYIATLWSSWLGIGMLVAGAISLTIGIFWMRKTVIVEV